MPAKARILVVDDERINREILSRMLLRHGYETETASNGREALQMVSQSPPDLVLLDVVMPEMDGLACLQAIRENFSSNVLPVIMVTAEAEREMIVNAFRSGANDYVTKPVDAEVTLARIATHIQFHASQTALQQSEERFALAVEGANAGIWDWDLQAKKVYFSPRWKEMLGYTETNFNTSSEDWMQCIHPEDTAQLCAAIFNPQPARKTPLDCELRLKHRDGHYLWMQCTGIVQREPEGHPIRIAGSFTDITAGKVHDGLTGLPNRILFKERLVQVLRREPNPEPNFFAVLFVDLDNFKIINDSLGHHIGDRLLVHVAQRLESCLRPSDEIKRLGTGNTVARHGGDEFTILLEGVSRLSDAQNIAERIITAVSEPYSLSGHQVCVGASVGIALGGEETKTIEDLLREADTAMYYAKTSGRGQHRLFDPEMQRRASERISLEKDLRQAVKSEEFTLYYQPIVDIATQAVQGFEALVRWQHPRNENIGPQQFIPVAEDLGLIGPLGHWIFCQACQQAAEWNRDFPQWPHLTVNVNCSVREFLQPSFRENIRKAIADTGVHPSAIKVELTESALMKDLAVTKPLLEELRGLGIRIGIDDFGTGYSSLAYLHRLPLDDLKIDRSFVMNMAQCHESLEIVRTILTLARSLNLNVVAEGIETELQRNMLLDMGCKLGQGYLFSRPVTAAAARGLLEAKQQEQPGMNQVLANETRQIANQVPELCLHLHL
jgi:diguanylate cyclase (GGDEF)-like protein/PAS domain S-box-containing protein